MYLRITISYVLFFIKLIRVRYHYNAVLPHNGGFFKGWITKRCFHNTTACKYVVHPKKVTGRKLRHTVKEVKNLIFHHLFIHNFLPLNLINFFIFQYQHRIQRLFISKINVCKKIWFIFFPIFKPKSQETAQKHRKASVVYKS